MRNLYILIVLIIIVLQQKCSSDGWISIFDGKTLNGWQPSENKNSWQIEDDALVYSTYHPEFGNWSGYGYLGTLQHDTFVYNTTGEQLIQSDTNGECTCKADVFSHKEWVFAGNHLIGRIIETKKLFLGTKDTCPDWVWTLLPSTTTTTWDGYRI